MELRHAERVVVFGNSGSGKSTYARGVARRTGCFHLDLDEVAWDPDAASPTRLPLELSAQWIRAGLADRDAWVVEGCYADLLELVLPVATELVFLNPGVETCLANARRRPWEPHKYASPEAQAANLAMLLDWIGQYAERDDEFSLTAHRRLFDGFTGRKREFRTNERNSNSGVDP